jgi:DNA-binding response OmpR family regulator
MNSEWKETPAPARAGDPVILCVDDEPEVLNALRRCFRNEPYKILTAKTPWEALVWMERPPGVDLVLLDQRMPGMTGTELMRIIRHRSPRTARAMLSGHPSELFIQKGLEAGAGAFFYKPWDDVKLRDTVRGLLSGRRGSPSAEDGDASREFDLGGEGG